MGMQEIKDAIKQAPISSIIGHYITVQKRGANHEAICPFHQDSHPSLKISDAKELYKCFACGASGDSIHFVREFKNLEFKEALVEIGSLLGLETQQLLQDNKAQDPRYQMGLRILASAHKIYYKMAQEKHSKQLHHFITQRGLSKETAEKFQLGFAPDDGVITSYLSRLKIDEKEKKMAIDCAHKISIIKKGKWGDFDSFRNRITFPIWDQYGQIKGFGSRSIEKDQMPKYLNSSESFLFNKRHILYALNFAKPSIRQKESVIVVEGYMDAIALHHHGLDNTVALMGVAISEQNVTNLNRLAKTIYLGLDNDTAGMQAMEKINAKFMEQGVLAKYLNFHPHKDPDDFLGKEGRLAMEKLICQAPNFIDFFIDHKTQKPPKQIDAKLAILQEVMQALSPLKSSLLATERLVRAAEKLNIQSGQQSILENYQLLIHNQPQKPPQQGKLASPQEKPQPPEKTKFPAPKEPLSMDQLEKNVIKMIVLHPNILEDPKIAELLENISNNEVKRTLDWLYVILSEVDDTEFLRVVKNQLSAIDDFGRLKDYIFGLLYTESFSLVDDGKRSKIVDDLIRKLKKNELKKRLAQLKKDKRHDEVGAVLKEMNNL